jgi:hypothetical protein
VDEMMSDLKLVASQRTIDMITTAAATDEQYALYFNRLHVDGQIRLLQCQVQGRRHSGARGPLPPTRNSKVKVKSIIYGPDSSLAPTFPCRKIVRGT